MRLALPLAFFLSSLLPGCPSGDDKEQVVDSEPYDGDADGYGRDIDDCNDDNPDVHPGADELCDGKDNNCDGETDGSDAIDPLTWCPDVDLDGYGIPSGCQQKCDSPGEGWADNDLDCSDISAFVNPEATEVCDRADVDEDCNGVADDDDPDVDPSTVPTWYTDADDDTYGDSNAEGTPACEDPSTASDPYSTNNEDCDDSSRRINPDTDEEADDGVDNDCDNRVDEDPLSGWTHFQYGFTTDPDYRTCDVWYQSDWTRQIDPCPDCVWSFEVKLSYDADLSYGADSCTGTDDIVWTLGFDADYGGYGALWYYAEGYGWYPSFYATASTLGEYEDHIDYSLSFSTGYYEYLYAGYYYDYYYTRAWLGYATVSVYE